MLNKSGHPIPGLVIATIIFLILAQPTVLVFRIHTLEEKIEANNLSLMKMKSALSHKKGTSESENLNIGGNIESKS